MARDTYTVKASCKANSCEANTATVEKFFSDHVMLKCNGCKRCYTVDDKNNAPPYSEV